MKNPKPNRCLSCGKKIENLKVGVTFTWWPSIESRSKLCRRCAYDHLTTEAFQERFVVRVQHVETSNTCPECGGQEVETTEFIGPDSERANFTLSYRTCMSCDHQWKKFKTVFKE